MRAKIPAIESCPILEYCEKLNITCHIEGKMRTGERWVEIFLHDKIVLQIDTHATVEQFRYALKIIAEDFNTSVINIPGDDFQINAENEELFKEFLTTYPELLQ